MRAEVIVSKKKTAKKSTPKPKPSAPKKVTTPRQDIMFDSAISSLEKLIEDYDEAVKNRDEYAAEVVHIKGEVHDEMRRLERVKYARNGLVITVVPKDEQVKISKDKKTKAAAAGV